MANSLNSTCARVMKESETTIEVSISSQTKGISFVVGGKVAGIKLAKRHLWSFLAQSVNKKNPFVIMLSSSRFL